ncbi:exported hypothetical protein [Rhodococcus sp. RD6.2]|uniref:hypothetical protein n=1 Tax=Rhodococcus sp. RD6.2 TaxID=260936 RepID=UPI00063BC24D|nr:hypothetical protein [Rhodococcus sp. RD6.2]CRK53944.1 exported hypothetical protein [Rhodococcus sp. RD6.2]
MGGLVRAGGVMLAAATIASGGLAIGAGTAGAEGSSDYLAPVCKSYGNMMVSYPIDLVAGSVGNDCHPVGFSSQVAVGNATMTYSGTDRAEVGEEILFQAQIEVEDPNAPDVVITSLTHHAPAGYKFLRAYASKYTPSGVNLNPVITVDPVTRDVTLTAGDGGWSINGEGVQMINVSLFYDVISVDGDSTSGVRVTSADAPASGEWMATGDTRAFPNSVGWLGSVGDYLFTPIPQTTPLDGSIEAATIGSLSLPGVFAP